MRRSKNGQYGLASVELALVTPFLLIVLLISAEFTRVFYEFNTLTKSVRDAARFAANDAYSPTGFDLTAGKIASAKNIAVCGKVAGCGAGTAVLKGYTAGNVSIVQVDQGIAPAIREHIQATATYTFRPLAPVLNGMGFLGRNFGMEFVLVARSTMRAL